MAIRGVPFTKRQAHGHAVRGAAIVVGMDHVFEGRGRLVQVNEGVYVLVTFHEVRAIATLDDLRVIVGFVMVIRL